MRKYIGAVKVKKHNLVSIFYLTLIKVGVIYFTLILPLTILDAPRSIIITGFILGHLIAGMTLSLVFQITHLCDFSKFNSADSENGSLENSFAIHVIENTSTFSPDNLFITYFSGGLNHQIHVCLTHHSLESLDKSLLLVGKAYSAHWKQTSNTRRIFWGKRLLLS